MLFQISISLALVPFRITSRFTSTSSFALDLATTVPGSRHPRIGRGRTFCAFAKGVATFCKLNFAHEHPHQPNAEAVIGVDPSWSSGSETCQSEIPTLVSHGDTMFRKY
jgi:hypothetical protein